MLQLPAIADIVDRLTREELLALAVPDTSTACRARLLAIELAESDGILGDALVAQLDLAEALRRRAVELGLPDAVLTDALVTLQDLEMTRRLGLGMPEPERTLLRRGEWLAPRLA